MKNINLKGVSKQTWVRTIVLILALVNQALVMFGVTDNEVELETWTRYATYIFTVISAVWSWWKNNSFTAKAQEADNLIDSQ